MAALAEEWRTTGQHARVVRTVRGVTEPTILANWCVLPKVWTAFLCMALVTGVIDRLTNELQLRRFPVRTVASAAIHLSLKEWMRKCFQSLAALQLMTVVANLGLCRGL